jgi:hypothetical protein
MLTFDKNNKNMKIKILRGDRGKWYHNTDNVGREFCVIGYYENGPLRFAVGDGGGYWVDTDDCVITELPKEFCVKNCEDIDKDKWIKYIWWLNKTYNVKCRGHLFSYYGINDNKSIILNNQFGTEIHIDDIIKHIDFYSEPMVVESKEEKKMETNILELIRLFPELPTDYAKKLVQKALEVKNGCLNDLVNFIGSVDTPTPFYEIITGSKSEQKADYVWRKIYDFKNKKMETQRLYRHGLKEIHSVACTRWKEALEHYGTRNPLEDYIELSEQEVQTMFNECTKEQLPIVSKYLKQDDGSVDLTEYETDNKGFYKGNLYILRSRTIGKYKEQSFLLSERYDWEIKTDEYGELCLIPTKKK